MTLSALSKTWLLDIDGTIFKHNGYKDGDDILLDGVRDFFDNLSESDVVILLTARSETMRTLTEAALKKYKIRYDKLIFDLPTGERILVNDDKPSGLKMGYAINKARDAALKIDYRIDKSL